MTQIKVMYENLNSYMTFYLPNDKMGEELLIPLEETQMEYKGVCLAVKDIKLSKEFYQDLFELEVFQDYGRMALRKPTGDNVPYVFTI